MLQDPGAANALSATMHTVTDRRTTVWRQQPIILLTIRSIKTEVYVVTLPTIYVNTPHSLCHTACLA